MLSLLFQSNWPDAPLQDHKEMSSILAEQKRPRIFVLMGGGGGSQPMRTAVHLEPKETLEI